MSERLPGGSLVTRGLGDLAAGHESAEALLVAIGAPRLRRLGVPVPDVLPATPEHRLFRLLGRENARRAHSRYNALIRRLVSYERARERERAARARPPALAKLRRLSAPRGRR